MASKKTHEEFVQEVFKLYGDEYTVLGHYLNAKSKVKVKHNICGRKHELLPTNFLRGKGCINCGYSKTANSKRKTHDDFVNKVVQLVGNEYSVMGKYTDSKTKLQMKHNICNHVYDVTPNNFLRGKRCPECRMEIKAKHSRKTHSDFINEVFAQVENEYSVLGEYVNAKTKIKIKHNVCNQTWEIDPDKFLQGRRCPECSIKQRTEEATKSHEDFVKEVFELVREEYTVVGKYISSREKIEMKHNVCNHTYSIYPYSFLAGTRCPECSVIIRGEKRKKTHEEFVNEVEMQVGKEYEVLGNYTGAKTNIKMKHNECGTNYTVTPGSFLRGSRCPHCNESKGEQKIRKWLQEKNINYEPQKKFEGLIGTGGGNLSYDFYLYERNVLIEYQGEFHDGNTRKQTKKDIARQQEHDRRKHEYAQKHKIKLLEIWYQDFDHIEEILEVNIIRLRNKKIQYLIT